MQIGMIGLGRMGSNMVRRLMRGGHTSVVYDVQPKAVQALASEGASGAETLDDFVEQLSTPRTVWLMLPSAVVDDMLDKLLSKLEAGDVVVDGGNSYYRDDLTRAKRLADADLHHVDCGTSGGVMGLERGYCLMVGGEPTSCSGSIQSSRRWLQAPVWPRRLPGARDGIRRLSKGISTAVRTVPGIS